MAQLALSLQSNEAFQEALDRIRTTAVDALLMVDADDKNAIVRHQATVAVVDDIRGNLDGFVRAGAAKPKPGIA